MSFKFVLNRSGVSELLKGEEIQGVLDGYASDIQSRAGEGYGKDSYVGKNRANSMVYTDSYEAWKDNMRNNTLLKARK